MRKERNQATVQAKVLENLQAGVGVASVVVGGAVVWYTVAEWQAWEAAYRVAGIATGAGAMWFGVLSVVRFSLDEMRDMYEWLRLQELAASYYLQIEQLKADNAELRKENRRLQSHVKTQEFNEASKGAREVVQAADKYETLRHNAEEILTRWAQGISYSRDATQMSRQDWEGAMRLLDSAGLIERDEKNPRKRAIVAESLAQAQKKVDTKIETWQKFDTTNFTPA